MHVKRNVDNLMAESNLPVRISANQANLPLTISYTSVYRSHQTDPRLFPRRWSPVRLGSDIRSCQSLTATSRGGVFEECFLQTCHKQLLFPRSRMDRRGYRHSILEHSRAIRHRCHRGMSRGNDPGCRYAICTFGVLATPETL
jgi:hypothetical protein